MVCFTHCFTTATYRHIVVAMESNIHPREGEPKTRGLMGFVRRLFWDKKFAHYTWIGVFVSIFSIFLLWLLIDIFGIPTIISGTIVTGFIFILRYILFRFFKIL